MSHFHPIYDAALERLPVDEQQRRQAKMLHRQLTYTLDASPFYRRTIGTRRIPENPADLFAWMENLPLTTRDDLARENEAFFCGPRQTSANSSAPRAPPDAPLPFR